jgi:hypothetical protein
MTEERIDYSKGPTQSPSQRPRRGGMRFADIIQMENGHRFRRLAWNQNAVFISMVPSPEGDTLCITGMGGGTRTPQALILRDGDLFSDDWVEAG